MATMINGQLILEEEYDENYQPTEQGEIFEKKKIVQRRIKLHNEQKRCFSDLRLILVFHEYIIFCVQWTVDGPLSLHIYLEVKSLISALICKSADLLIAIAFVICMRLLAE